jgi:hypothetical protein
MSPQLLEMSTCQQAVCEATILEDPPGNNVALECCYGMVLLRDAVQK